MRWPRWRDRPVLPGRSLAPAVRRAAAGACLLAGLSHPALSHPALSPAAGRAQTSPGSEAGPAVERVRLRVEAAGDTGAPRVELEYRLRIPAGTREIPLHGLRFAGVGFGSVEARLDGRPVEVSLRRDGRLVRTARLPVPAGAAADRRLRLAYALEGTRPGGKEPRRTFDLAIPLLRVDWPPAGSGDETFRASVILPADARLTERLPTVPLERSARGRRAAHAFSLPAVPSLLRFRGRRGGEPLFTLGRWVDVSVLSALALLALWGWRAVRRREA